MKKDAFLIGFFLGAGVALGSKGAEKLISYLPKGVEFLKGVGSSIKSKRKDDGFEDTK